MKKKYVYERTHNCGELTKKDCDSEVKIYGWVNNIRNFGKLIFLDLKDKYGITQIFCDANSDQYAFLKKASLHDLLFVKGEVIARKDANDNISTGEIEVLVKEGELISSSRPFPFSKELGSDIRLKYRYLDIRDGAIRYLEKRAQLMAIARNFLVENNFLEVTTPLLCRATPGGAEEFLVPTKDDSCYALPQSPQVFKQLLMVGGVERYFQIAPCFRNEDSRKDRQPEFYQIDLELSFASRDLLFSIMEEMLKRIFLNISNVEIKTPFEIKTYEECMKSYGTDKPDLRFGMKMQEFTDFMEDIELSFIKEGLARGHIVKGFVVERDLSRKEISDSEVFLKQLDIRGICWLKKRGDSFVSNILKWFRKETLDQIAEIFELKDGETLLFCIENEKIANKGLDQLRRRIAEKDGLIDKNKYYFLWVIDFPLFEENEHGEKVSVHHPFTATGDKASLSYDLVLNGYEIGGGSRRISDADEQYDIMKQLNMSDEEIEEHFGFFIEALRFAPPPHLGIALGVERILMILCNTDSIRDVVPFPKTLKGKDLLLNAPVPIKEKLSQS